MNLPAKNGINICWNKGEKVLIDECYFGIADDTHQKMLQMYYLYKLLDQPSFDELLKVCEQLEFNASDRHLRRFYNTCEAIDYVNSLSKDVRPK